MYAFVDALSLFNIVLYTACISVTVTTLWLCVSSPDQMQGTVTLKNISISTSGLYQCTSSNAIGKSTCLLNLQVAARK